MVAELEKVRRMLAQVLGELELEAPGRKLQEASSAAEAYLDWVDAGAEGEMP